jgi:prefoldin subunit 5
MSLKFDDVLSKMDEKHESLVRSINLYTKKVEELESVSKRFGEIILDYDNLKKEHNVVKSRLNELERRNTALEHHANDVEQRARRANVEIQNLTEHKGENLQAIVSTLANKIGVPLLPADITAVHRVSHGAATNNRPKNIILKFSKTSLRDAFLDSAKLKRGLTTEDLGIQDKGRKIYISEHLTLKNKLLYRDTRIMAKAKAWKFTWTKNSIIYVRKDTNEPVLRITTGEDLQKIL